MLQKSNRIAKDYRISIDRINGQNPRREIARVRERRKKRDIDAEEEKNIKFATEGGVENFLHFTTKKKYKISGNS